eukprot:SAG22_NODE_8901_length_622_cov_1.801147_1_plen_34_part_01
MEANEELLSNYTNENENGKLTLAFEDEEERMQFV